jgi:hypothetical protein
MMLGVVALAGIVGYTIFASVQSSNTLALAQRNSAEMDIQVAAVRQALAIADAGQMFPPMGEPSVGTDPSSMTTLPAWVSGSPVTPWGAIYGYCPYAPSSGGLTASGSATVAHAGTDYSAGTVQFSRSGASRAFVMSPARPAHGSDVGTPPDVIAFLVSPTVNASAVPACDAIYWDGRVWRISGATPGSVRAITRDMVTETIAAASTTMTRYVAPSGTGDGRNSGRPMTLQAALAEWRALEPTRMTLRLASGVYPVDFASLDFGSGAGASGPGMESFGRVLRLVGAGSTTLQPTSAGDYLSLPMDVILSNVDVNGGAGIEVGAGARLLLTDGSQVERIRSRGGEVVLGGGAVVGSNAALGAGAIEMQGGRLEIAGAASIDASAAGGPAVSLEGATMTIDAALGVTTDGSALAALADGGSVSVTASGSASLNGSALTAAELEGLDATEVRAGSVTASSLDIGLSISAQTCGTGVSCTVSCPAPETVISASCSSGNSGIGVSQVVIPADRSSATCTWTSATSSPRVTAVCAAIE